MEIVTDPKGVAVNGRVYPAGTPLGDIPATSAEIAAWRRFKQIGEAAGEQGAKASESRAKAPKAKKQP